MTFAIERVEKVFRRNNFDKEFEIGLTSECDMVKAQVAINK